jgi:hypothetical protein
VRTPVVSALQVIPFDGKVESVVDALVSDIADGIYVLAVRDGFAVSREMAEERARNIVCGFQGRFHFEALPPEGAAS